MNPKMLIPSSNLHLVAHRPFLLTNLHPWFELKPRKSTVQAYSSNHAYPPQTPSIFNLKHAAAALIFATATFGSFPCLHSKAEVVSPPAGVVDDMISTDEGVTQEEEAMDVSSYSPLAQLLVSNSKAIDALKTLLQQKLEAGEDSEGLAILRQLSSAQPDNLEWKFMMAKVLNEMGKIGEAREVFEEILAKNPLSFEALFENALLMDRSGEGESVIRRLQTALSLAETENKAKEARDVKLIMAQMHFLQKNLDVALRSYEELINEDPNDFRPYFCKGMIFSLLDKNTEARDQFAKYRQLSPKKFEVEGYLRSPLSRMKLFGTDEED